VLPAYHLNLGAHCRIGNVPTVPSQKIVHAVYHRNCNGICIHFSLWWDWPLRNQCLAEFAHLLGTSVSSDLLAGDLLTRFSQALGLCPFENLILKALSQRRYDPVILRINEIRDAIPPISTGLCAFYSGIGKLFRRRTPELANCCIVHEKYMIDVVFLPQIID